MVEASVSKESVSNQKHENYELQETENSFLTIGGSTISAIGKVALAIGTTGILMFLFTFAEAAIGLGAVYTGCIAVCAGIASMVLGNKLQTGFWLEGALAV